MRAAVVAVRDERSLLMFMCDKRGGKHGIERLLRFFYYNFIAAASSSQGMQRSMQRFKDALRSTQAVASAHNFSGDDGPRSLDHFAAMSLM